MASRDRILKRLRSATGRSPLAPEGPFADRDVFSDVVETSEELIEQFRGRLEDLSGEVRVAESEAAALDALRELIDSAEPGPWLAQRAPVVDAVLAGDPALAERFFRDEQLGLPSPELARYSVGVSACSSLVARTGSVVLNSRGAAGRRLSVLPPLHIVIARRDQLIGSLDEAIARLETEPTWSFGTIITGPSRTADIEKILVLGAHGPKRLAVIVVGDP